MQESYQVIVGNIGEVYHGTDAVKAMRVYCEYVNLSDRQIGRAAGEPVTLMGEQGIYDEHPGTVNDE